MSGTDELVSCCSPAGSTTGAAASGCCGSTSESTATTLSLTPVAGLREQVRERYSAVATSGSGCCGPVEDDPPFGSGLYDATALVDLPADAIALSLGCGNPGAIAEIAPGDRVLDLGSGAGIDILLAARQVGPTGHAIGVDMTPAMIERARSNVRAAGATNVDIREGEIENLPVADASVDVVISNCVVNLSTDKPAVLAETFRVLTPGGRIAISDVVAEDHLSAAERAERGSFAGCIAGALSRSEYLTILRNVGFEDPEVTFTGDVAAGMHNALVSAGKPRTA
ncbi:arsenite methyltransferase [Georgenia sp. Z1491]|uniref:arsenite methyltransferase n=1 Tax=Georgenia sp. Z1491 TaxID=3416707 RepID=UPI003CF43EFF